MATLQSPGVQVTIVNESFYNSASPGTVPMIFVATAANKSNASGTGIAQGTLPSNAGVIYTITSQRDLADTFGTPLFYTDASGNPIHGGELNEYGLQAAYSMLGVSAKAFVVRADVDLSQLAASASAPDGGPVNGTYWVDSADSLYGVFEWDATNKVFVNKVPLIIDNDNKATVADLSGGVWTPKVSFGVQGNYAMVVTSENTDQLWFKNTDNAWVVVGSNLETNFDPSGFASSAWQTSWPVATSTGLGAFTGTTFTLNGTTITVSTATSVGVVTAINGAMYTKGVGAKVVGGKVALYADATAKSNGTTVDGKIALADGTIPVSSLGFTTTTYANVAIAIQPHTQYPQYKANKNPSGSVYVKTTSPGVGANWLVRYFNGSTQSWTTVPAPLYSNPESAILAMDSTGGAAIPVGNIFVEYNYDHGSGSTVSSPKLAEFKLHRRNATGVTKVTSTPTVTSISSTSTFQIEETIAGSSTFNSPVTVTIPAGSSMLDVVSAVSAAGLINVSASYDSTAKLFTFKHALGGEIKFLDGTNAPLTALGFGTADAYNMTTKQGVPNLYLTGAYDSDGFALRASNWKPLVYEAKSSAPFTLPADGTLWYSSVVDEVDIMYHNGSTWVGYKTAFPDSDPNGPQVTALAPTTQSDGTDLVDGDIWVSTADIDKYGISVYVWNADLLKWVLQDVTDQVTPDGWVFADARWATTGQATEASSIVDLLSSDFLDPDAPDPALYPQGIRLWNLRRSGFNVKRYVQNYIDIYANGGENLRYNNEVMDGLNPYFANRWVTTSPNNEDGSGRFGRFAQRSVVVEKFKALIDANTDIRDTDSFVFNIMATPGYPEAIQNMVAFNVDRGMTALVVGDTPFRLKPNGTDLLAWGNNSNNAFDNGETGGVTHDDYLAMFYPSGYTNDNTGNAIVVPPSHMMLRTIINSDAKSYPWFAPAGTRRGVVDNVSSVGYLSNGEFKPTSLYTGLRDVLAEVNINPITSFPGVGILNFGQKTRSSAASAMDRINVVRLICYLRRQLDIVSRPFLFEPNDKITRNEIKASIESLLLELVGQRALYDFIVVCDETNNTPARIDRNELWVDIAIEPVKAIEFIYIPLRLLNTGSIAAGL